MGRPEGWLSAAALLGRSPARTGRAETRTSGVRECRPTARWSCAPPGGLRAGRSATAAHRPIQGAAPPREPRPLLPRPSPGTGGGAGQERLGKRTERHEIGERAPRLLERRGIEAEVMVPALERVAAASIEVECKYFHIYLKYTVLPLCAGAEPSQWRRVSTNGARAGLTGSSRP